VIPLYVIQKKELGTLLLLGIIGLFSYGFQFEIERGQFNMIAFALCLLAIYIFHYQHKFRYFSYLLFSLAVQLKLYPAIFILMFIRDWRDWKNNIRRILGVGVFNFLLLFSVGYQLFQDFMRQITSRQLNLQSSRFEDLSISGFTYFLAEDGLGIPSYYAKLIGTLLLVLFGIILLTIIVHLYRNRKNGFNPYLLLVCTIGALMIPTASFDYKLPILVAPMIILLSSMPKISNNYKKAATIMILIIMSMAYWSTLYPYNVKSPLLFRNSPALLTILFATTIMFSLLNGKFENIIGKME
ncbi:MAG: glycosyltransferase family 87 protein, partial [Anaerolineales bacterium]